MPTAHEEIVRAIRALRKRPVLAVLDGRSGSGKTYLVRAIARCMDATVIPADDFFAAEIPDVDWEERDAAERARDALDWAKLRAEALEPLLGGTQARWRSFDFERGPAADGSYRFKPHYEVREPRAVILLDGAYSARPELSDLIDLAVLVEASEEVRWARLKEREDSDFLTKWQERWGPAERYYFSHVRPPSSFDLIIENSSNEVL